MASSKSCYCLSMHLVTWVVPEHGLQRVPVSWGVSHPRLGLHFSKALGPGTVSREELPSPALLPDMQPGPLCKTPQPAEAKGLALNQESRKDHHVKPLQPVSPGHYPVTQAPEGPATWHDPQCS